MPSNALAETQVIQGLGKDKAVLGSLGREAELGQGLHEGVAGHGGLGHAGAVVNDLGGGLGADCAVKLYNGQDEGGLGVHGGQVQGHLLNTNIPGYMRYRPVLPMLGLPAMVLGHKVLLDVLMLNHVPLSKKRLHRGVFIVRVC